MKKLLIIGYVVVFTVSCNVTKILTQGKTDIPDDFNNAVKLPFNANPLTMQYKRLEGYLKNIESTVPTGLSFALTDQKRNDKFFAPIPHAWVSDWNGSALIWSQRANGNVTAAKWIADQVRIIREVTATYQYESITWKMLNTAETLCAVGLILGNQLGLSEYTYPADGTYSATIDESAAYAMKDYCNSEGIEDNIGLDITVTVSTPASTAIYDKQIDVLGDTFFLSYTDQGMNFATVQYYDSGNYWSKLVVSDDMVSNGLRMEFFDGANNVAANDDDEIVAVRVWLDSTSAGAALMPFWFHYYQFFDGSGSDSEKSFSFGGNINTSDRMPIMMMANELSTYASNEDYSVGCFNKVDWSINTDNSYCASGNEVDGSLQSPEFSSATAYYNFSSSYNGSLSTFQTLNDTTTTGFTAPGNMQTSSF